MIMCGSSVTSAVDALKKISEEMLFHSLRNPKPDIEARMRQLRTVYSGVLFSLLFRSHSALAFGARCKKKTL